MSSVEVQQRLNELRLQKQNEAEEKERRTKLAEEAAKALVLQQEKERKDAMINCEAEAILFLETLTDAKIISDFTKHRDKEPDLPTFVATICATETYGHGCPMNIPHKNDCYYCQRVNKEIDLNLCIILSGTPCRKIGVWNALCFICKKKANYAQYKKDNSPASYSSTWEREDNLRRDVKIFKTKYIWNYVSKLLLPIFQERQLLHNEREKTKEQQRRQTILDETNSAINKMGQTTFTNLTLSDWDKRHEKQFISTEQGGWSHYKVDTNNKTAESCYTGMPASFANYYEEGKVPFFTKCPTCNSLTKFNYLNKTHNGDVQRSCSFKEVYCDKHYFYDSCAKKHFIANNSGQEIQLNHPNQSPWRINCWLPSIRTNHNLPNSATKWKEWDPSDPDGSTAMAEKKKLETDDIQRQILELQTKLAGLK